MAERLKVTYRAASSLTRYERNARTHSDEQVAQIARSIETFGWTNPILIDEAGGIIAGHGRLAAAESLGLDKVPTITLAGLTDDQKRALVIADNQLALNAGWDFDTLRDVWEFPRVTGEERHGHATPKPVAMMERCMVSALPEDGICAEPFGGTGATLIGCEKTGRVCYTMELKPNYCDVIVRRWQEFTGQAATLEGDGRTFDEVAAENGKKAA